MPFAIVWLILMVIGVIVWSTANRKSKSHSRDEIEPEAPDPVAVHYIDVPNKEDTSAAQETIYQNHFNNHGTIQCPYCDGENPIANTKCAICGADLG